MPPSDQDALDKNKYDGFYKVRARDFWGDNEINRIEPEKKAKCEHEFKATPTGAECSKCGFGLIGPIEVKDGKLFSNNKPLNL